MKNSTNVLVGLVAALFLFSSSAFTVDQTQFVIVQRLGEIVSVKKQPGMHFKLPIVDNLKYFDNRILTLDWEQPAKFITSENKYMMVDSFVKWRIIDPAKYYVSIKDGGEAAGQQRSDVFLQPQQWAAAALAQDRAAAIHPPAPRRLLRRRHHQRVGGE